VLLCNTSSKDWEWIIFADNVSALSLIGTSWRSPISVFIGPSGGLKGPGAGLDMEENEFSSGASRKDSFGSSA